MLLGISKLIGDQKERCIQLCRLFPENYEFFKDVTIQLWEAEFFMDRESAESVFKELELSNDFLFSRIDHSTQQRMYKLATIIHDNENLRIYDINSSIPEDILHMSLPDSLSPAIFKTLHQATKLLTLFILHDPPSQINKIPHHLFLNLPYLRELDMSRTNITDLPSSIGNLENLRYLNLSWTPIRILPNSLCNLIHLITLKLRGCSKLLGLPKDITKLKLLKYLDVDAACLLASMPPGIGNLTCLQSLPVFVVGKDDGYHISELKHMVNLCGTLRILRLEDISCVKECQEAALNQKQYLSKLEFHWTDSQNGYDILENLQPHRNLLDLKIVGYGDVAFPIWISNPLCSHLTAITIDDCSNCEHLPPLGNLQYLKFLCISNMDAVKVIEHQFYSRNMDGKAFPSLENFTLSGMSMLENWGGMEEGDFRHLKQLNISDCPVITAVPELPFLLSLQQLEISFCPLLKSFGNRRLPPSLEYLSIIDCPLLRNRCDKKDGEIWQKLAHVPIIRLDNQEISQERPSPAIPVSTLPLDIVNATVSTSSTNNRDKRKDVMYGDVESTSMSPSGSAEDLERPSPAIPVSPLPFDILNATVSTSSTNNRDKGKDVMYGDVESTSMSPSGSADLVASPFLSQHFDATIRKQSTSNMDQEKDVMDVVDCRPMPLDVEENLVESMKEMFINSTAPTGLIGFQEDKVPASEISFSLQKIWNTIKENKDLDLPAHKVMVATVRCDEIIKESFSKFCANQDWRRLEKSLKSGPVLGFGKAVNSILTSALSEFDEKVAYFDEGVRVFKRQSLLDKMLQLVKSANDTMLEHLYSKAVNAFKEKFDKSDRTNDQLMLSINDCTNHSLSIFDEGIKDMENAYFTSWDTSKIYDRVQRDIATYTTLAQLQASLAEANAARDEAFAMAAAAKADAAQAVSDAKTASDILAAAQAAAQAAADSKAAAEAQDIAAKAAAQQAAADMRAVAAEKASIAAQEAAKIAEAEAIRKKKTLMGWIKSMIHKGYSSVLEMFGVQL